MAGLTSLLDVVADAQSLNQFTVLVNVAVFDVLEQAAPLTDELHQAAPRVVVLLVNLEVLGEVADALSEDGNLNLCAARVLVVFAVLLDELGRLFLRDAVLVSHFLPFTQSLVPGWASKEATMQAKQGIRFACPNGHTIGELYMKRAGKTILNKGRCRLQANPQLCHHPP